MVDRNVIDGGFAVIETKQKDGTWKPIELYAVANIITFNTLEKGASHEYIWNTKGYNKSALIVTSKHEKVYKRRKANLEKCGWVRAVRP